MTEMTRLQDRTQAQSGRKASIKEQKKKSAGGASRCAVLAKRAVCVLLTAILLAVGFPVQFYEDFFDLGKAEAAEGTSVTKTYILETTTGINDGAQIEFFEIRYTDKGNVKRRQYIFPNEDSLMLGRIQAAKYGTDPEVCHKQCLGQEGRRIRTEAVPYGSVLLYHAMGNPERGSNRRFYGGQRYMDMPGAQAVPGG